MLGRGCRSPLFWRHSPGTRASQAVPRRSLLRLPVTLLGVIACALCGRSRPLLKMFCSGEEPPHLHMAGGAQVRLIQFSPEENFVVTYSPVEPTNPREEAGLVLNLFDSRTGRKLRNFAGSAADYAVGAAAGPGGALKWPVFQWAGGCGDRRVHVINHVIIYWLITHYVAKRVKSQVLIDYSNSNMAVRIVTGMPRLFCLSACLWVWGVKIALCYHRPNTPAHHS